MCESSTSDDMTSFEVVSHQMDSLAEFTVIQEPPPLGGENLLNGNFDNIQSAFMSGSQDLSVQEIQERILELAKDNTAMKEALEWNNVMMKEQLGTITAWHNELTTSMSKQQLSLKESAEKVEALEKENSELREKLKQVDVTERENAELREKLKQLEKNPNGDGLSSTQDCRSVQTDPDSLQKDIMLAEMHKTIQSQNLKLESLKQVTQEKESLSVTCGLQQLEIESIKNKCMALENQQLQGKERYDVEVQSLKMKISDLETQVLLEQHATEAESVKHRETIRLLSLLESKNQRVTRLLQAANEQNPSMCYEQSDFGKRQLEQIDNLTAQIFDLQEKLAEREEKVNILTSQLQAASQDSESIPVLKSQVEVYKIDLNRVKEAKEEADREILRLNQMIEDLQASFSNASPPFDADAPTRPKSRWNGKVHVSAGSRQGAKLFICPLCNFGFSDAQAAQNHANKCLDEAQVR